MVVKRAAETSSIHPNARITGIIYLAYFLAAIGSTLLLKAVIVPGDALATASHIRQQEPMFYAGFAVGLISIGLYIALTARLYELFRVVDRNLSLLGAFFSLAGCTIQAFSSILQLVPLMLEQSDLRAFSNEQLRALTQMIAMLQRSAINLGFVFFGMYCLLIGYLIIRSMFLPRVLGALLALAGLGWLTFLVPPLAAALSPYIQASGVLAEALFMLWLLVFGVNMQRWTEEVLLGER